MSQSLTVACVQNCAGAEIAPNLEECAELTKGAARDGAQLVCLPEYFSSCEIRDNLLLGRPFPEDEHPALPLFSGLAKEHGIWILLGSLAIGSGEEKFANRSYLLDAEGAIVARYDKIHLFDVNLPNGEIYVESGTVRPGDQAVLAATPWGPLGLTICYDLRFAALYRGLAQAGAKMLAIPAAFTKTTGEAHWHVLQRARAIETGCFVFAPSQFGLHAGNRACYGHSLIVDPWGHVLAEGDGETASYVMAEVDLAKVQEARDMIPSLSHDRDFTLAAEGPVKQAAVGS